jgi:hypothetical protein
MEAAHRDVEGIGHAIRFDLVGSSLDQFSRFLKVSKGFFILPDADVAVSLMPVESGFVGKFFQSFGKDVS